MNITKAFIERNRLKKYINELSFQLEQTQTWHDKRTGDRVWSNGKTIDSMVQENIELKKALCGLNTAIDKANIIKSRELLNQLETAKACLVTVEYLLKRSEINPKEITYQNGVEVVIEKVSDVDIDKLREYQKFYKKEILYLEDSIAASNAETEVKIPEDLKNFLENYAG